MKKYEETRKIVIIYAAFGSAWIYFSDTVLNWLVRDAHILKEISIFKGLLFILATSVLLYVLIAIFSNQIKQSTNALKESEQLLRFLVKNSSDSLVIINVDGSQRYVSPGAEKLTGFPIAELEGRTIDTLIHPDDIKTVMAVWQEAIEHPEKTFTVQYRHIHKDKKWVFAEAVTQSFLNDPTINGVIASVRDISARMQAEEETKKLQEQLAQAQKIESVGRLAGGVAHDFNNMLGVILGYSEMALEQMTDDHSLYSAMLGIQEAAQRSAD